jgi:hypothetical protein
MWMGSYDVNQPNSQGNGLHLGDLLKETARLILSAAIPVLSGHLVAWLDRNRFSSNNPNAEPEVAKTNGES